MSAVRPTSRAAVWLAALAVFGAGLVAAPAAAVPAPTPPVSDDLTLTVELSGEQIAGWGGTGTPRTLYYKTSCLFEGTVADAGYSSGAQYRVVMDPEPLPRSEELQEWELPSTYMDPSGSGTWTQWCDQDSAVDGQTYEFHLEKLVDGAVVARSAAVQQEFVVVGHPEYDDTFVYQGDLDDIDVDAIEFSGEAVVGQEVKYAWGPGLEEGLEYETLIVVSDGVHDWPSSEEEGQMAENDLVVVGTHESQTDEGMGHVGAVGPQPVTYTPTEADAGRHLFISLMAKDPTGVKQPWYVQFGPFDIVGEEGPVEFNDIEGILFQPEIEWLSTQGITTGYDNGDGTFSYAPSAQVLREQMAAFLYRFEHAGANPDPVEGPSEFVDVPANHVFKAHIAWLASTGITTGYDNGNGTKSYAPAAPVLREQMAAFLYRLAGSPEWEGPAVSPFTDLATSHVFYDEITWLADTQITTGYDNGNDTKSFQGSAPVLREQMAAFLFRFNNLDLPPAA